jgi:hypothetical protein
MWGAKNPPEVKKMESQLAQKQNIQIKKHKYFTTIKTEDGKTIKLGDREVTYLVNVYKYSEKYGSFPFMYDDAGYINDGYVFNIYIYIYVARIFKLIDKGLLMRRWTRKENGYYSYQLLLTPLGFKVAKALLPQS